MGPWIRVIREPSVDCARRERERIAFLAPARFCGDKFEAARIFLALSWADPTGIHFRRPNRGLHDLASLSVPSLEFLATTHWDEMNRDVMNAVVIRTDKPVLDVSARVIRIDVRG
jgi:hypothetical protein